MPLSFLQWTFLGFLFYCILLFLKMFHNLWVKEMVDSFLGGHVARMLELSGGFRHEKLR